MMIYIVLIITVFYQDPSPTSTMINIMIELEEPDSREQVKHIALAKKK